MFLIPTQLGRSSIHGVGVFTPHEISAGTRIWEFTPDVDQELTEEEIAAFPDPFRSKLLNYAYLDDRGIYILCGDNARFMNHSSTPNCDDSGAYTVAARRIEAGEELTCDYRSFDRLSKGAGGLELRETMTAGR